MKTNRKTIKMPVRYLMNLVLVGLLFVGLSYVTGNMLSTYQNKVLLTVGINIILAVSLNVATGYLGQLPLGHAGFMAVGAYACALFTKSSGLPKGVAFAIGLVLAWVVAGLFGVLIGIPALRLTGDYLAILTLGFGEIIRITLNNIDDVLGFKLFYGSKGLKNIPKYSNFTNVFLCVVITCFLIHAMMKSRHGRAVLAIRDNEIAAESCGIQTTYYKVMAFAFSAAFAGLAGVGDLIVTCTSMHSRNLHAGMLIGRGKSVEEAKTEVGQVVEGINALPAACRLAKQYKVEMPIVQAVEAILDGKLEARSALMALMGRSLKRE